MPRKKPRRIARFAAAAGVGIIALSSLAACGGDDESGSSDGPQVALLLPESKTARYEKNDRPEFTDQLKKLCPDCTVVYSNAEGDAAKQQQQIESAVSRGVDAIVIDPVDVQAASQPVQSAIDSGIPVISYMRLVADADVDYYVSVDPYKGGQQQAQALLDTLKSRGVTAPKVVMVNGAPTDSNAAPFKKGAHSVFDPAGVDVVREYDTPDWDPAKAQTEMQQAITALGKDGFDGVYVTNDGMASGVIAALKAAGIDPSTKPVTGQDAETAALQRIVAGEQYMTLYTPILDATGKAAEIADALVNDKTPPEMPTTTDNGASDVPSLLEPMTVVTVDTINSTVIAENFVSADDICTDAYAEACRSAGIGD